MSQLRIGVIGVTGRGELRRHWRDPEGRSVVVDVAQSALEHCRENVNGEAFATLDCRELLERKDVDAVAVMGPDFVHEEHVYAAFEAGKHVFSEKPMAITTAECDRTRRAMRRLAFGALHTRRREW